MKLVWNMWNMHENQNEKNVHNKGARTLCVRFFRCLYDEHQKCGYWEPIKHLNIVGTNGSWSVIHESISWSHEPKIHKISVFQELFFPQYDNFKIISADHICLSTCLYLNEWALIVERKKLGQMFWLVLNYVLIH